MNNILIFNTILEESADYSELINDLTGNYVAQDITTDEKGEELETPIEHPHKDLEAPNFSGHIVFAHFVDGYSSTEGVSHIEVDSFSTSKAWNIAFSSARDSEYSHVVILNNVKKINPHYIVELIKNNTDKDCINIADGGAFIVKTTSNFVADEEYNVWFADNKIFEWASNNNSYVSVRSRFSEFSQVEVTTANELMNAAIQADLLRNSQ